MKKIRNIKLLICLLLCMTATASGITFAADEDEIPRIEENETAEESLTSEVDEDIDITYQQAEKLLDKIGTKDGYEVYAVPDDYEERIWASHGGNPRERDDYDPNAEKTPQQISAEEEISLVKQCGDMIIIEKDKKKAGAAFFKSCKSDDGRAYISGGGQYLLIVNEELTNVIKIREAVSVTDDKYLFGSSDSMTLELMSEDYSRVEETYFYSEKEHDRLVYKTDDGRKFAWIGTESDRVFGTFRYVVENEKFRMIADDRTAIIGLENKETGYIWWSSPLDTSRDEAASPLIINELRSSSVVRYGIPEKRNASNWIRSNTEDCSVTVSDIKNGIRVNYDYYKAGISFPVEYTIGEDCLKASLKVSEISETKKENVVTEISLLGSFGAGSSSEEGYFLIPDGSGALIRFNNGKIQKNSYSQKVYGADITAVPNRKNAVTEQIYLPVYGIVKEDNALLAVASKGASNAVLNASTSGISNSSYNLCNFSFILRNTDSFYMSGDITEEVTVFQRGDIDADDIEVRYYPISKENASYTDIAARYRKYLVEEAGVIPKAKSDYSAMYVDLYGGTEKKTPVLGIPVTLNKSVTDYSQAKEILAQLRNSGVENMVVSYNNWTEDGIENKIDTEASPSRTLGGDREFKSLKNFMDSSDILFYPASDNRDFYSGNGYYSFTDTSVRVSGAYSRIVSYDRAYGVPDGSKDNKSLLSPSCFKEVFEEASDNYCSAGLNGISLGSLTSSLYGDYGRKEISRFDTMNLLIESYEDIDSKLSAGILADGANAYALPYVSHITGVPLNSSRFDIFDEDVPFYQLVMHGIIPYSTIAINSSADSEQLLMQAIAVGSQLNFDFIYEDVSELKDTEFDIYYYANYEYWLKTASAEYKFAAEILSDVSGCTIEEYIRSADGQTAETVYSDGTVIKVNFSEKTIDCGEKHYDLEEYARKEGICF